MGLAAPRKRRKIGLDPNNTAWTRDDTTYGHRILASKGWTPGSFLGAKDAAHAALYTAANASHIRVALREDRLGLGARQAGVAVDPLADTSFGLGGFQDLLGRLNGKSETALEKERQARNDIERQKYLDRKWGAKGGMGKFVRGGFLVGDRILDEQTPQTQLPVEQLTNSMVEDEDEQAQTSKMEEDWKEGAATSKREIKQRKKRQKEEGKEKRRRHTESSAAVAVPEVLSTEGIPESKEQRRQRKLEKRARKEAKRLAKAGLLQTGQDESEETALQDADEILSPRNTQATASETIAMPTTATEMVVSNPQPVLGSGRHMARQRYIKNKRMSMMDPTALKEILMLKS